MASKSRPRARQGVAQVAVTLLVALSVVALSGQSASAAGNTILNSEPFTSSSTASAEWTLPTAAGGAAITNTACLTASSDVNGTPIPGCSSTAIDQPGSGVLRLTNNSNNQVGTVYSTVSVPTSKGLDIKFTSYQWNDNHLATNKIGADGIAFVLAATNPVNPSQPSALGPAGGALGYAQESTTKSGVSYGYLGVGLDNYGNYTNTKYGNACPVASETTGLTNNGSSTYTNPNASHNTVTVRGPGNGTTGYCEMTTTSNPSPYNASPYSTTRVTSGTLDAGSATTRPSGVPVEIALNSSAVTVATASGLSVPANSWLVSVTPQGGTAQQMTGLLPSTAELSTLGFPSSWINTTTGLPYQLTFGWAASTGGAVEYHEISNQSITTLSGPLPDYNVAISDSRSGTVSPGDSFVASISPSLAATGGDEPENSTVTTTFPSGLTPPASSFTTANGYSCSPNRQVVSCTYTPTSTVAAGTTYPALLIPVTTASSTAVGNYIFTSKVSSLDANPAIVSHTVAVATDVVTAVNDTDTAPFNTAVSTNVLANDTRTDTTKTVTPTVVTNPAHGSVSVNADGTIRYTPNTGFSGTDSYTYQACDNSASPVCSTAATVTVTVTNSVVAANDTDTTTAGSPVSTNVLGNDTSANAGKTLTPTVVTNPAHGTATVNANGTITYTPTAGFSGSDSYTYRSCDNSTPTVCSTSATVTITVINVVTAVADTDSTTAGSPVAKNVTLNDSSADPSKTLAVTISNAQKPSHGTVSIGADARTVTYTPGAGFSGSDSYRYTVCDNSATPVCATATVSITVSNVVVAVADSESTTVGSPVAKNLTSNDTSADASKTLTVTVSNTQNPSHGTVSIGSDNQTVTYTPTAGYSGTDSFRYTVCDDSATPVCDSAAVSVSVSNVVQANHDVATVSAGSTVALKVTSNDTSADTTRALSVAISTAQKPSHGTVSIGSDNHTVTYAPASGFSGSDSFRYTVCDDSPVPVCDSAPVSVTVDNVVHAFPDTVTVSTGSSVATDVIVNDTSEDASRTLSVSVSNAQNPSHGTVSVGADHHTVTYTPNLGYSGADSYSYTVCDDSATPVCDTAAVSVNAGNVVTAVDDSVTVVTGSSVAEDVTSNDISADANKILSVTISNPQRPSHGTVTIGADQKTVTYTPAAGFSGQDTYLYTVCDNSTVPVCNSAMVSVTVTNSVHAVVDSASVTAGSSVATDVVANDTNADVSKSLAVTISNAQKPAHGTVSIGTDARTVTYTPASGYSGSDSYSYTVCDNSATPVCSTATVSVTVANAVVAVADSLTVASGSSATKDVVANDTTANASATLTATISNAQKPAHGTAVVGANGKTVTYTPTVGYSGPDSFSYTVCDNSGTPVCDSATVSVTVTNVVTAVADTATGNAGGSVTTDVLGNDTSADTSKTLTATISSAQQPAHGTATVTSGGITYTPAAGFSGADSYRYTVCDDSSPKVCDTGTVSVVVNNRITADLSGVSTTQNTAITAQLSDLTDTTGTPLDPSKTTIVTPPAHGTLTKNSDGSLTYRPATGFAGADSFRINVCDTSIPSQCATVTVPVNVGPDVVIAVADSVTATSGGTTDIAVMSNDSSQTGQPLDPDSVQIDTAPLHGTASVVDAAHATASAPAGSIRYTPTPGYVGSDSFRYRVCDTSTPTPVCGFALVTLAIPAPAAVSTSLLAETGTHPAIAIAGGLVLLLVGFVLILWRRRSLILAR